ncbi:MAG: TadE/TadG family type IV pilus assembly protein [Acidimicrobiales bacterium]
MQRRGPLDRDRGATAIEFVILVPVMVLLLMVVVQFGVYFHTRAVVTTAARHGVDDVRVLNGTADAATATTNQFLDQTAGALRNRSVTVDRNAAEATVTVTGDVLSLIPFVSFPVEVSVDAPVERIVE